MQKVKFLLNPSINGTAGRLVNKLELNEDDKLDIIFHKPQIKIHDSYVEFLRRNHKKIDKKNIIKRMEKYVNELRQTYELLHFYAQKIYLDEVEKKGIISDVDLSNIKTRINSMAEKLNSDLMKKYNPDEFVLD